MKPSIGRIVHYVDTGDKAVLPAIITAVYDDDSVDLTVFYGSRTYGEYAVAFEDNAGFDPDEFWRWPPRV